MLIPVPLRLAATLVPLLLQPATSDPSLSSSAFAQTREEASDTAPARTDTVPPDGDKPAGEADTVRAYGHNFLFPVGLAAMSVVLLTAPPTLLFFAKPDTTGQAGSWDDHIAAYVTGGAIVQSKDEGDKWGWTHSVSIEVFKNGVYGELRIEDHYFPDHFQFQSVRAGYLFQPTPSGAGGLTLAYRRAQGEGVHDAFEIGLPLFVAFPRGGLRFEPTYLVSSRGVEWHYRWLGEFHIPRSRLVAGFSFEAKTRSQGSSYFYTMALMCGMHH